MHRKTLADNADYACPIVGTCLTIAELRRLCRKCGLPADAALTDYEAHSFLVHQAKLPGSPPAKFLQRYLDKKYRQDLRTFRRCDTEDGLRRLWRQRAEAGDIPGAFWAILSHPLASEEFVREVFGEVHMLSHRVGAANRADLARLALLEERLAAMTVALEERKSVLRQAVAVWKGRCRQAMEDLAEERNLRQAAERERLSLREIIGQSAVVALRRERDILRDQLMETTTSLADSRAETDRQAALIEHLHGQTRSLCQDLSDRDGEVAALEASLFAALGVADAEATAHAEHHAHDAPPVHDGTASPRRHVCACAEDGSCPCPLAGEAHGGLWGKRVLYVGGRASLVAHYKVLAEKFGCELMHHDGGREQSNHRLWELLGSADAVVCPVDCVSHEACHLVKQACKGCLKPLVLARSSGLSSLARSLTELGGDPQ